MLAQVLQFSLDAMTATSTARSDRPRSVQSNHPLSAYPTLLAALTHAEKNGMLAAERRNLARHWPASAPQSRRVA